MYRIVHIYEPLIIAMIRRVAYRLSAQLVGARAPLPLVPNKLFVRIWAKRKTFQGLPTKKQY